MITLRNLSFSHLDSPPLFRSIDLEVARGERVLLIGRSGAGKSTLLAIIAGLVPDYVPGELSGSVERESDAIGIVFQNPEAQMVAPSVIEELAFALENRGVARGEMRSRIAGVASRFGLSNFLARAPAELSGGERQKVALASAITLRPEILLLDEPTSYLDPKATREFFELLELLPPETTVVMVEHKIDEALRHATRVIELTGSGELTEIPFPEGFDRAAYLPWRLKRLAETRTSGSYAEGAADGNVGSGADGPMNRPALVRTVGLHHSYDDGQAALLSVSLALRAGESVAVMGPNGAGKSTLLAKVAGLLRTGPGEVFFEDADSARLSVRERFGRLLLMPQNPEHFFLREIVEDELELAARIERTDANGVQVIDGAAGRFGLAPLEARNPYSLSEGEKRRLNLACAFLDDRQVLLLDEPTFGLDYDSFETLVDSLRALSAAGSAMLFVTHSPELAFLVADRIVFLERGKVYFEGTPDQARANHALPQSYLPVWEREPWRA